MFEAEDGEEGEIVNSQDPREAEERAAAAQAKAAVAGENDLVAAAEAAVAGNAVTDMDAVATAATPGNTEGDSGGDAPTAASVGNKRTHSEVVAEEAEGGGSTPRSRYRASLEEKVESFVTDPTWHAYVVVSTPDSTMVLASQTDLTVWWCVCLFFMALFAWMGVRLWR